MRDERGLMALNIPATTGPATVQITTAQVRLHGWSIASGDVTNTSAQGTATSVAAGAVIATLASVAQGEYTIRWQVQLSGAPTAADVNNFGLYVNGVLVATSVNRAAAGAYPQADFQATIPAGGVTVAIKAIGAGTAAVAYVAGFSLVNGPSAEGFLDAHGQTLAVLSIAPPTVDRFWIGDEGLYVPNDLNLVINSGTMSGCVWVKVVDKSRTDHGVEQ